MHIRRFTCPTEGEALEEIRTELGEDAIILSYRKTEAGVVIIAMENEKMEENTALNKDKIEEQPYDIP